MRESHGKDLASHPDPESCVGVHQKAAGEALTGAHAGQPSSCEIRYSGVPTLLADKGDSEGDVTGKPYSHPAQSKTLRTHGNSSDGKREIPRVSAGGAADRPEKAYGLEPGMHARGKSDGGVVPKKSPNKDGPMPLAEAMEGRRPTEGNTMQAAATRTQSRFAALDALDRVREAARRDRRARSTALLHHGAVERLHEAFCALRHEAALGVDGVTWEQYDSTTKIALAIFIGGSTRVPTGRSRRVASSSRRPTGDSDCWASRHRRTR
jgi:RNA-directed DNA polymerase